MDQKYCNSIDYADHKMYTHTDFTYDFSKSSSNNMHTTMVLVSSIHTIFESKPCASAGSMVRGKCSASDTRIIGMLFCE